MRIDGMSLMSLFESVGSISLRIAVISASRKPLKAVELFL